MAYYDSQGNELWGEVDETGRTVRPTFLQVWEEMQTHDYGFRDWKLYPQDMANLLYYLHHLEEENASIKKAFDELEKVSKLVIQSLEEDTQKELNKAIEEVEKTWETKT